MKGEKQMKFSYDEKTYQVNVHEVFMAATKDDYIDFVEALGISLHISCLSEIGISAMIVYDDIKDVVSVEITIDEDDFITINENEIELTNEERSLIVKNLQVL